VYTILGIYDESEAVLVIEVGVPYPGISLNTIV
jgi:hypothetical protein